MDSITSQNNDSGIKKLHLEWILPTFLHPKKTINAIVEKEKPVWLTPLLVLSLHAGIAGLVAGPIRRNAALTSLTTPDNFQYFTADQQAQFMSAQSSHSSVLFTFIFPTLGAIIGIWIAWFLLSSILHMSLTLAGSRTKSIRSSNLVAWTMLPLALRFFVQIIAMLVSRTLITSAGLSGFVTGTGGAALLAGVLSQLDVFFIWQLLLLFYGVLSLSGLTRAKAWGATATSVVIVLLLMAIPKLISSMLSGLSLGGLF
ncbi:MAG: YIP1 family protein [Anaerolineaceae bacterium]